MAKKRRPIRLRSNGEYSWAETQYLLRLVPDQYGYLINTDTGRRERRHSKCRCRVPCQMRYQCWSTWHVGSRATPWCSGASAGDVYDAYCDDCTMAIETFLKQFKENTIMATAAKTFTFRDAQDEEDIEVSYWVHENEEDDVIGLEKDGMALEQLSFEAAEKLAHTIKKLSDWAKTPIGKKKIKRLRDKAVQEYAR